VNLPDLPLVQSYHPTTFLERGVAVPFTTPLLGGTRARPGDHEGLDLIVPNPSGGRGVYVMNWSAISELCRPTLHDKLLSDRIGALISVTPAAIRLVARQIAAEGLAGEEAMEAAKRSIQGDHGSQLVTNYQLLVMLVEQVGLVKQTINTPGALDMESRARMTVAHVARILGKTAPWVATALEGIADCLTQVGISSSSTDSKVSQLMILLRQTRDQIADWSGSQLEEEQELYARMVAAVADLTLALATTTVTRVHALTGDLVTMLREWAADSDQITRIAARPEWLLDGWEKICMVWAAAKDDAERRAALAEVADLVPIVPKEAKEWCEIAIDIDTPIRLRKLVRLNEDWRTGATVFSLIARNEQIRAVTC